MRSRSMSGLIPNSVSTWSSIWRCWAVTQTTDWTSRLRRASAWTTGAILVAFTRAANLHRFLEFIGTKYFEGKSDEIKEYTVAVHALNRPEDFDPRADTIVRVTAVALRKRLEQYYATEGASHPVQLDLPSG